MGVTNHLLTGMILQVPRFPRIVFFGQGDHSARGWSFEMMVVNLREFSPLQESEY